MSEDELHDSDDSGGSDLSVEFNLPGDFQDHGATSNRKKVFRDENGFPIGFIFHKSVGNARRKQLTRQIKVRTLLSTYLILLTYLRRTAGLCSMDRWVQIRCSLTTQSTRIWSSLLVPLALTRRVRDCASSASHSSSGALTARSSATLL